MMANNTPATRNFFDDDFFGNMFPAFFKNNSFEVDVKENDKDYEVKANLPGFNKDDIHLEYANNILTIEANHEEKHEEKEEGQYLRKERSTSSVRRQFIIRGVDESAIKAEYKEGVLSVELPKAAEADKKEKHIPID